MVYYYRVLLPPPKWRQLLQKVARRLSLPLAVIAVAGLSVLFSLTVYVLLCCAGVLSDI